MLPREGSPQRAVQARKKVIPPRPELLSTTLASIAGILVFLAVRDVTFSIISWIIAFLIVFPFAVIVREVVVLSGTRRISNREALAVFEWIATVARIAGVNSISLLYTYRERNGLQLVGLGEAPDREEQGSITFTVHKAAWLAKPLPALSAKKNRLFVVVPGLLFERVASMTRMTGSKPVLVARSLGEAKLVYHLVKSILYTPGVSKEFLAYSAVKLYRRLIVDGLLVLSPRIVDEVEKSLPFENPFVRKRVLRQLAEEETEVYTHIA